MKLVEGTATVESVDAFVADLAEIQEATGAAVQAFDARYVAGRRHLEAAVAHANRAFDRGENVADDRSVEILLYAAGRRQIRNALEMGVSEGENDVVVVVDGGDEPAAARAVRDHIDPGETLDGGAVDRIEAFFDIGPRERKATTGSLEDLVRERVALLDVEK